MAGKPWFAWEWLYDVIVGELESRMGLNGVVWFTALIIAAVFASMFRLLMKRGVNLVVALVLVLLAFASSTIHFLARPHVLSWLFALIWFWILETSERRCLSWGHDGGRLWLWTLPLITLVWVNVHGGFLIGFILLGIFWLGAIWSWLRAKDGRIEEALTKIAAGKRSGDLIWVGLVSLAASLINPYGWRLHAHIYSYLTNRFLMDHIEEFQSPNFHGWAPRCFAGLLLISLAALSKWGRKLRTSEALTALFAAYAGMYSSRNIPVSSLLLVMVVAPLIWPDRGGLFERMRQVQSNLRGYGWPFAAVAVSFWIVASMGHIGSRKLVDAHFDPKRMPVEAVNQLQRSAVKGPVLSPDYWGGYLIYRWYPEEKVVVDDRHDLYGEAFFKSYLKMLHLERGWQEFLREHQASCLLLPRDAALANVLLERHDWNPIYEDETAIAFVPVPAHAGHGTPR
jgi:hypothetical protein